MIQNQTRGLFGNWSTDLYDDFTLPDGTPGPSLDINNLESLHNSFKKIQISILFAMIRNSNF
jgi:hypothetical protein